MKQRILHIGVPWLAIAAVHAVLASIVSPAGDFPMNDDWVHMQSVEAMIRNGAYVQHPYVATTLLLQVVWGAFLLESFGGGFETLRLGTLALSTVCGWGLYGAARAYGARPALAAFGVLLLLSNVMYLNLAYDFMTDVPFLALCALAGWGYMVACQNGDRRAMALGSLAAAAAFLVRPFSVVVTLGFALAWAADHRTRRSSWSRWVSEVFSWAAPWLVAGLAYVLWLAGAGGHVDQPAEVTGKALAMAALVGLQFEAAACMVVGFAVLPLFIAVLAGGLRTTTGDEPRPLVGGAAVGTVIVGVAGAPAAIIALLGRSAEGHAILSALGRTPYRLPLMGNTLADVGTGPVTAAEPVGSIHMTIGAWWWGPTILACAAFGWVAWRTAERIRSPGSTATRFLAAWMVFGMLLSFNPLRGWGFDRYLLTSVVPMILLSLGLVTAPGRRFYGWAYGLSGAALVVAAMAVRDYLEVHRVQSRVFARVHQELGAAYGTVDGGYALNGYFNSPVYRATTGDRSTSGPFGTYTAQRPRYRVLVDAEDGPVLIEDSFTTWLGGRRIFVRAVRTSTAIRPATPAPMK